jgi:hypothetical protein
MSPMRQLDPGGTSPLDRLNRRDSGNKKCRFRIENGDRIDVGNLADAPSLAASRAKRTVQPAPQELLPRQDPPVVGVREFDRLSYQRGSVDEGYPPARRLRVVGDLQHGKLDAFRPGLADGWDEEGERRQKEEGRSR